MIGKLMSTVIGILITVYVVCLIIFFFLHQEVKENINRLNYETVEIVSTSGRLDDKTYRYLTDNACKFGDYIVKLKLEKQIKPGVYDTYFDTGEIINKPLRIGDRISIYLEDRNLTLFGRLINATFLNYSPDQYMDVNIKSIKSAVISKNAKNLVKGYDVIADIQNKLTDPALAILVITKLNPSGKYYGLDTHEYVNQSNMIYGDSSDEAGNTGVNYIFDNGDFIEQVEYYTDGFEKCRTYIQQ